MWKNTWCVFKCVLTKTKSILFHKASLLGSFVIQSQGNLYFIRAADSMQYLLNNDSPSNNYNCKTLFTLFFCSFCVVFFFFFIAYEEKNNKETFALLFFSLILLFRCLAADVKEKKKDKMLTKKKMVKHKSNVVSFYLIHSLLIYINFV